MTRLLLAYPVRTTRFTSAFIDSGANWAPRPVGMKCPGLELLGKMGLISQRGDWLFPATLLPPFPQSSKMKVNVHKTLEKNSNFSVWILSVWCETQFVKTQLFCPKTDLGELWAAVPWVWYCCRGSGFGVRRWRSAPPRRCQREVRKEGPHLWRRLPFCSKKLPFLQGVQITHVTERFWCVLQDWKS